MLRQSHHLHARLDIQEKRKHFFSSSPRLVWNQKSEIKLMLQYP